MSNSSSSRTQWIYVDDTDVGMQYSGDWARKDFDDAYSHTLTCAKNSTASLTYQFDGTAIEVHGYTFANDGSLTPVQATFSVDNLAPYYTTTPKVSKQAGKCIWFYNEMLAEGQHTLVIHVVQASSDYPFCFDYIKYPPSPEILQQPPQPSPATTTSSPDGAALCSRVPTGAIIGGVIGGITLLALALYFLFFRRGWQQKYFHLNGHDTDSEPLITPFNTHAPPQSQPISPVYDLKSSNQPYDPIQISFPDTSEYSGASVSVIPPESGSEGRMISTAPRHQGYEQHASPTQESLAASVQNVELSSTNQAASEAA